jgi:hypothetical protein
MSVISIQCRLVANEPERKQLWQLMVGAHTPLVNTLLERVAEHPKFPDWKAIGQLPANELTEIVKQTRQEEIYVGLPGRWISSAQRQVADIYKAWLKRQRQLLYKRIGQQNWLAMLQSDEDLIQASGLTLEQLKARARVLLSQECPNWFGAYQEAKDDLERISIAYLLKHHRQIPEDPEDLKKLAKMRRQVEIRIERLKIQLQAKLPSGRDLASDNYVNVLTAGTSNLFETDEAFKQWQSELTAIPKALPFPVNYASNSDLNWSMTPQGRLCVKFNGLGKLTFKIYCDRQQLPWFQRFYQDQQVFKQNPKEYSQALFTLRSVTLTWKEGTGKGDPWQANYLYLHCSLETLLWSQEGTQIICDQKAEKTKQLLDNLEQKEDLTPTQQKYQQRKRTELGGLTGKYPRPQHPLYAGQSQLIVGVSLDIEQLASVVLLDVARGEVMAFQSLKQLLGKDYTLVHRLRYEQRHNAHDRKVNQAKGRDNKQNETQLATHVDRVIAKAIISFAQQHLARSVALPKIKDIREVVQSQIQARAELRIPDSKELQRQYAKQYRMNAHQWSYSRLLDAICNRARKKGLIVEEGIHARCDTAMEQAKGVALSAYALRSTA